MDINQLYTELIKNIRNASNYTLEEEDILLLFSKTPKEFQQIFKDKEGKEQFTNRKLLSYNIYTDFWKLIKTPSFISRINLLLNATDKNKNKYIKRFIDLHTELLSGNIEKIDKNNLIINNEVIDHFGYFNYLIINGKYKQDENRYKLIPQILLSLYLECCIHIYSEIITFINKCYDKSIKFGNSYSSLEDFKFNLTSWLNYRINLNNKLNGKQNVPKMYNKSGQITYNITELFYIDISDIYSQEELIKIESLCRCRDENLILKNDSLLDQIDQFFKSNKKIEIKILSDPSTFTYVLFQAMHAYDQIIKEMIISRFTFLSTLRTEFNKDNDILDNSENIIYTLRQYLNYPLTFQYKLNTLDAVSNLLSENSAKIVLEKTLKMLAVIEYCNKNKIDIKSLPSIDYKSTLNKLTITKQFTWDKLDTDLNLNNMHYILNKINDANNQVLSYLDGKTLNELSKLIKGSLKTILSYFNKEPFLSDIYENSKINDDLKKMDTIVKSIKNYNDMYMESIIVDADEKAYYFSDYKDSIDTIQNEITNYNVMITNMYINSLITSVKNIFSKLFDYRKLISKFRNIIDKKEVDIVSINLETYYPQWTIIDTFLLDPSYVENSHINYDNVSMKDVKPLELTALNIESSKWHTSLSKHIPEFNLYFNLINTSIIDCNKKKDDIDVLIKQLESNISNDKTKLDKEKATLNKEISTFQGDIIKLNTEILTLKGKINTLNTEILTLKKKESKKKQKEVKKKEAELQKKEAEVQDKKYKIDENKQNITDIDHQLNCIDKINTDEDLKKNSKYKTSHDSIYDGLKNLYEKIKKNHVEKKLFKLGTDYNLNDILLRIENQFYEMTLFISYLLKEKQINFNINDVKKFEYHRIKYNLFDLIDKCNNNSFNVKNGTKYVAYPINHRSTSIQLLLPELFKNNKLLDQEYTHVKNITDKLDNTKDNSLAKKPNFSLTDYENTINTSEALVEPTKFAEVLKCTNVKNMECNISVYQIITYLNNSAVFNMCEKIYEYLASMKEISRIPNIDTIIEILRSPQYKDKYSNIVYTYNELILSKYNVSYIKKKEYLIDKGFFDINKSKLFINSDDINNRIDLKLSYILDEINKIDEKKFIKFFFKEYRNSAILIDPMISAFKNQIIPFDDLYFYRNQSTGLYNINIGAKEEYEPYYFSYFSLNSLYDYSDIRNGHMKFSNVINEINANLLEFTNGKF
jgi:hypothetical protein